MSHLGACAEFHAMAAELAVGVLSGSERAGAVAHLARCPSCQQLMVELTGAADELLLLAPEIEPPPGFESRVLARLAEQRTPRRSRLRTLLAVAAIVMVAAVGGGLAAQAVGHDGGGVHLRTALAISASGRTTCRVVLSDGRPASLLISLDGPPERSDDYVAEIQPAHGKAIPVGRFSLAEGHGMLVTTVAARAADVKSVRVLDTEGKLLYEAFPAPAPAGSKA